MMDVATFSTEGKCKRKLAASNCGNRIATNSSENLVSGALAILRLKTEHVEISFCASCSTRGVTSGVATFIQRGPDSLIVFLVNDKKILQHKTPFPHRHCRSAAKKHEASPTALATSQKT